MPWLYQLFMSVDLNKSTDFKKNYFKKDLPKNAEWALYFQSFYNDFTENFFAQFDKTKRVAKPSIWKCLGDEVIYYVKITDSEDVEIYVDCLMKAIRFYNASLSDKQKKKLPCQGTVWGAGFPIRNRTIKTPTTRGKKVIYDEVNDFIGFDMDLGFRISKHSKPERLVVSLPIAYILSLNHYDRLRYYDAVDIKGIGQQYPIFWVSSSENERPEINWHMQCASASVKDFCEKKFDTKGDSAFSKPFIVSDKSHKCEEIPDAMVELKKQLDEADEISNRNPLSNKETKPQNNKAPTKKVQFRLQELKQNPFK